MRLLRSLLFTHFQQTTQEPILAEPLSRTAGVFEFGGPRKCVSGYSQMQGTPGTNWGRRTYIAAGVDDAQGIFKWRSMGGVSPVRTARLPAYQLIEVLFPRKPIPAF